MQKLLIIINLIFIALATVCCGRSSDKADHRHNPMRISFSLTDSVANPYDCHFDSMPNGGRKIRINSVGPLARVFNDSNYLHLQAAAELGIIPVDNISQTWNNKPVIKIESGPYYFVDNLTHSLPYLVPEAKQLLDEIARTWRDSLESRGGGHYRLKVTSVLRTPATIARLRRRNRNAVEASAHQYGTTFDISYAKFICDSVNIPRTQEDLKNLLGEVLAQFRNDGRCYIKYERKQGCFHITARKPISDQQ